MAEHDGAGYPLSYCLLSTASSIEIGKRKKALEMWTTYLRDHYKIQPRFVHLDKDLAEIRQAQTVWPEAKIQLCKWHLRCAVRERLSKLKLSTTPYNVEAAHRDFAFISLSFYPAGVGDTQEFEGGLINEENQDTKKNNSHAYQDPNAVMLRIPASQPLQRVDPQIPSPE
jgi:hypothetical protein